MYKQLLENKDYERRVCGMHANLARAIRDVHKQKKEQESTLFAQLKNKFHNRICALGTFTSQRKKAMAEEDSNEEGGEKEAQGDDESDTITIDTKDITFGIIVGGAVAAWWEGSSEGEDVVIYFLLDVENIDSKMITFVHKRLPAVVREALYKATYKYDASSSLL